MATDGSFIFLVESVFECEGQGSTLPNKKESDARGDVQKLENVDWHLPTVRLRSRHNSR